MDASSYSSIGGVTMMHLGWLTFFLINGVRGHLEGTNLKLFA